MVSPGQRHFDQLAKGYWASSGFRRLWWYRVLFISPELPVAVFLSTPCVLLLLWYAQAWAFLGLPIWAVCPVLFSGRSLAFSLVRLPVFQVLLPSQRPVFAVWAASLAQAWPLFALSHSGAISLSRHVPLSGAFPFLHELFVALRASLGGLAAFLLLPALFLVFSLLFSARTPAFVVDSLPLASSFAPMSQLPSPPLCFSCQRAPWSFCRRPVCTWDKTNPHPRSQEAAHTVACSWCSTWSSTSQCGRTLGSCHSRSALLHLCTHCSGHDFQSFEARSPYRQSLEASGS